MRLILWLCLGIYGGSILFLRELHPGVFLIVCCRFCVVYWWVVPAESLSG